MADQGNLDTGTGGYASAGSDWTADENFWRTNYASRPYVTSDRNFEYYRPGYRYGYEAADRHRGRAWNEVEPELRSGWNSYEGRGQSTWEHVKGAVRDAWDRVTGHA
jgi:hypothetical protein